MSFRSLFASWKPRLSRSPRPQPRPARRGTCLILEQLEDRTLPSSYSAASVSALIADISAANTAGGANTITLTAATTSPYALTAVNNTVGLKGPGNGLPVIAANDNLTIVGNGDTIERTAGPAVAFRLLDVAPNASLTLQDLTLQGGLVEALPVFGGASGGAIYNAGALTLSGVTVASNQAYDIDGGGGAYGGGIWSDGSLTLENGTLLESNIARGSPAVAGYNPIEGTGDVPSYPGGAAFGGAAYVAGGTANITNTTFTANSAIGGAGTDEGLPSGEAFGGALYVAAGQVILTNAAVNNNSAYTPFLSALPPATGLSGGGLYIAGGTVTLANDTVESNAVGYGPEDTPVLDVVYGGYGGGLYVAPAASVSLDAFTLANTINNSDSSGTNGSTANIDGSILSPYSPTVVNAASASPTPVSGTTANLSVLGNDPAGQSVLTYTWTVTSAPAGAATPTFSSNGSNAAQDTTATFYLAGSYTFQVTLADPSDLTVASRVTVIVNQTLTSISVTPGTVALAVKSEQQFQAVTLDQFAQPMAAQPSSFTWSIAAGGIGSISSSGAYTAPNSGTGSATIQATTSSITGIATVTIKPFPPVITAPASAKQTTVTGTQTQLQVQAADPQGASLSYAWSVTSQPTGAPAPTFSNANTNTTTVTFHQAGSYTFTVTVTDALGLVSTSSVTVTVTQTVTSLSVTPATVTLGPGATEQFTATALDQFGQALVLQPIFTWQVTGNGGTISSTGLYTAPKSGKGTFQVKASADGLNAQANVTVT